MTEWLSAIQWGELFRCRREREMARIKLGHIWLELFDGVDKMPNGMFKLTISPRPFQSSVDSCLSRPLWSSVVFVIRSSRWGASLPSSGVLENVVSNWLSCPTTTRSRVFVLVILLAPLYPLSSQSYCEPVAIQRRSQLWTYSGGLSGEVAMAVVKGKSKNSAKRHNGNG